MRLALLGLFCVAIAACAAQRQPSPPSAPCVCDCGSADAQPAKVDQALMALLGAARGYHHQADLQIAQGNLGLAEGHLRDLLKLDFRPEWPEAQRVRLDAVARLALLLNKRERGEEALAIVRKAQQDNTTPSFYLANIHAVEGEILEHQAKALRELGKKKQADALAKKALKAFQRSIDMNKSLLGTSKP